jgi:ferredoxin
MPYIIAEPCVGVKSGECVDVCPVACIHTTPDSPQNYIDPDICIECEQCVIVCPVEAIFLDTDLPEKWHDYIDVNAAFFRKNKAAPEGISLDKALHAVEAVHAYASENGLAVSVAVVDGSATPIALGRMDGADPRSMDLALNKAYTAAAFQVPSHQLGDRTKAGWFKSLAYHHRGRLMPAGGGYPLVEEIALIGAIGVAGGPSSEQDVLCCRVGMSVLETHSH